MISVYQIKPAFQKMLQPVLVFMHRCGITANALTLAAILLSAATGTAFWYWESPSAFLLVPAALFLRMALNALDGMMARQYQMQSRLGEVLNEVGDVISDVLIFLPFIRLEFIAPSLLISFVLLAVLNEFAGVLGKAMEAGRRYEGPMGKSDRAFLWGLLCLALYFWPSGAQYFNDVLISAIILVVASTFIRLKKIVTHSNSVN